MTQPESVGPESIGRFRDIIDARSPAEFADDHIPGARSCPVLDDAERAQVGTTHAQVSAFEAKRQGAALVARNIARHIETAFAEQPRDWHPLIYCWRGGKRSRAMALILTEIGWHASVLTGGYKAYRRTVRTTLTERPAALSFIVLCGETGSAKSALLQALARAGAQVLDLEALACHRGSVLGELSETPQPSQRRFESDLASHLARLDAARPVFVEAESRKIGNLHLPEPLVERMRGAACVRLEAASALRVRYLLGAYPHFVEDREALSARVGLLAALHGHEQIARWRGQIAAGDLGPFVGDILERHYDPAYRRSMQRNFPGLATAPTLQFTDLGADALDAAARALHARYSEASALTC